MIPNQPFFVGRNEFVWWQGVVEDVSDPLKLGRCRVRCLGFHTDDKILLPTEHLPWAVPIQPIGSAAMSGIGTSPTGLLPGSWVVGFFRDSNTAQDPIIMGSIGGMPDAKPAATNGFSDPSGVYPRESYLGESDVNRLARNESISETIVAVKKNSIVSDVSSALGEESWSEPETPYNAVYPQNHVTETVSGHISEMDDTPGAERIHTYHKSGTFQEIHPDGSKVTKVVGKNYEILLDDNNIKISGTKNENVDGNCNLVVSGSLNIQVAGDANVQVKGNSVVETLGDHFHKVSGVCMFTSTGNMTFLAPRIDFNPTDASPDDFGDIF